MGLQSSDNENSSQDTILNSFAVASDEGSTVVEVEKPAEEESVSLEQETAYEERVDYAAETLENSNVLGTDNTVEYLEDYLGTSIAIVEVADDSLTEYGVTLNQISTDAYEEVADEYDMLISYSTEGNEVVVVSPDSGLSDQAYLSIIQSDGSTIVEKIKGSSDELIALTTTGSLPADDSTRNNNSALGGFVLGGAGLAVAIAAISAVIAHNVNRANEAKAAAPNRGVSVHTTPKVKVPQFSSEHEEFEWLLNYYKNDIPSYQADRTFDNKLLSIKTNLRELYSRIDRMDSRENAVELAKVELESLFKTLNEILSPNYYRDVLLHGHLWDDPEQRIKEVHDALELMDNYLLESIKKVNASSTRYDTMDFNSKIDGLKSIDPRTLLRPMEAGQ